MSIDTKKGVPGVPLAALDAIQDQNTRQVLRAIVDGWHVRNGSSGKGDMRFITAAELGDLSGVVGGMRSALTQLQQETKPGLTASQINRIITDLQASVMESVLFKELGDRIRLIDLSVVTEQQARIAAVQQVADDLAEEAATRLQFDQVQGSQISSLQSTTATQATQISGLTTRVDGAESTIVSLQSTTASQATSLNNLTTRVNTAESNITSLQTTTASQATSLNSLTTRVGTAESNISTLNTTTANQANSLTSLTTRVSAAESAITTEQTTRANADNAITTSMTTQFANVNGNISALQTQQTTTANNVAALSSSVSTLQATVGQNTAAIQTEATARLNADNDIYAKYSVKIDVNGYVAGYGLISTANNSTPTSDFIVRADRFAIGSPSGPGITPRVPFIVLTTTDARGNPAGVYIDKAVIKRADIGTLFLDGNAVTVPSYGQLITGHTSNYVPVTNYGTLDNNYRTICTATVVISGLASGETAGTIITGYTTFYEEGGNAAVLVTGAFINGTLLSQAGCTLGESKTNAITGFVNLPNGTHTVTLGIRTGPESGGDTYKNLICVAGVVIMSGKR